MLVLINRRHNGAVEMTHVGHIKYDKVNQNKTFLMSLWKKIISKN